MILTLNYLKHKYLIFMYMFKYNNVYMDMKHI